MTYSINVRPYNDPYIKIAEEAVGAIAELLIPGAFLVDIIPILKYVPEWFPGAKFQRKAAVMRKHAAKMRNMTFAATEELMVSDLIQRFFSDSFFYLTIRIRSQASNDYDPSFVTEALRDIQYSDIPNQDINMMKNIAVTAYLG
jgi:hypothetical protein